MAGSVGNIETGIIKNGLVFNMDAANRASYINGNTKAFNTTNLSQSGSLINDVSFNSENQGVFIFDGVDDYVDCGNMYRSQLSNATALTIHFWAYSTSSSNRILLDFKEGTSRIVIQRYSNSKLYLYVNGINAEYTNSTSLNTWYHITYVFNGSESSNSNKLKLYVNGVEIAGASFSGTVSTSIGAFTSAMESKIGALYNLFNPSTYNWQGDIGPIHFYNRALSSTEVLHNYNALKSRFGL